MPARVLPFVLALGLARVGAPPSERARVLLWPQTPALAGELAELPTDGGAQVELVGPDAIAKEIDRARTDATKDAHSRLAAIEAGLAQARDEFLAQRWAQMEAGLLALEQDGLAQLADPRHCESLWELEFRLALAYRGRKQPGDDARAQQRLALALALAPSRRPLRELYGPDVLADFLVAVDAASGQVARPLRVTSTPSDAQISIDCTPLDEAARVELRPGLHVLHAHAPGHAVHAELFEVPEGGKLAVTLPAAGELDAVRRLGATTPDGVVATTGSGRRALVEAAAARDLDAVVVLSREGDRIAARVLSGAAVGPLQRSTTVASAVASALTQLDERGHLRAAPLVPAPRNAAPGGPPPPPRKPLVKRWWFWTSIVATVGLGVGLGVAIGLRSREADRFEIVAR